MAALTRSRLMFAGFVLMVLIGGFFIWRATLEDAPLDLHIPPPPAMPHPNALDYYLKANSQLNALPLPGNRAKQTDQLWDVPATEKHTLAEKDQVLADTRQGLATLREGFNYPYMAPANRSFKHLYPEYSKERDLARYLRFAAQTHAAHGDWSVAAECDLDALRLGTDPPHGASLIGMLVGVAIQSIGRSQLWESIPHLNAAQARSATARMTQIVLRKTSLADTIQEEKWSVLAGLQEVFQQANWRKELTESLGGNTRLAWQLYFANKNDLLQGYAAYMDKLIAEARKPYPERKSLPEPTGILSIFSPVFAKVGQKVIVNDTENALILTALALHAYKAEHGAYPVTLTALVPSYLPNIPADPFAVATSLRYKNRGEKYLLYSIGPDGKDDGGRPIENKNEKIDAARYAVFDSYNYNSSDGDIVAGMNFY